MLKGHKSTIKVVLIKVKTIASGMYILDESTEKGKKKSFFFFSFSLFYRDRDGDRNDIVTVISNIKKHNDPSCSCSFYIYIYVCIYVSNKYLPLRKKQSSSQPLKAVGVCYIICKKSTIEDLWYFKDPKGGQKIKIIKKTKGS